MGLYIFQLANYDPIFIAYWIFGAISLTVGLHFILFIVYYTLKQCLFYDDYQRVCKGQKKESPMETSQAKIGIDANNEKPKELQIDSDESRFEYCYFVIKKVSLKSKSTYN